MLFSKLHSAEELEKLVLEIGFLPFFHNCITGFSVEECTPSGYWFVDGVDGPWEWKGCVARGRKTAYAKLFDKKTGYVSAQWYSHLANYRRGGMEFDERYREGLAPRKDSKMMETLRKAGPCLSVELKRMCFGNAGTGFETAITRLQMQTYVTASEFIYKRDGFGRPYGWGIAQYTVAEDWLGKESMACAGEYDPAESMDLMTRHLKELLPHASGTQIIKLLR